MRAGDAVALKTAYGDKMRLIAASTLLYIALRTTTAVAQTPPEPASTGNPVDSLSVDDEPEMTQSLMEVTVRQRQGIVKLRGRAENSSIISANELKRAACCNLGESFTTNPSVDVSYSDAATGARQIKLLGLAGKYVQMLTENIPNFRGAASPYGLGYVAGPWMQSIQVSKGASSVKHGYESISGQINVEMKKPQTDQSAGANGYVDIKGKAELNADGNIHLSRRLSTGLLLHGENSFASHDGNGDGFLDMPRVRQVSAMNRWAWMGDSYVFQAGIRYLDERRKSGQDEHHRREGTDEEPYRIEITTHRWEGFTKNAYIFDKENDGNVALILSGSMHRQNSGYGHKVYDVDQKNFYASLMFERRYGRYHSVSTGASFNYDHYDQHYRPVHDTSAALTDSKEIEGVPGIYAQYTLNIDHRLLAMAGIRWDHSSLYGSMFTPRVHLRWNPNDAVTIHGSAGKGYRSVHVLAENNYLLASSRRIVMVDNPRQEEAWNTGAGIQAFAPLWGRTLNAGIEYYYTRFSHQLLTDLDSDPHAVIFKNADGRSFSHALQAELTYELFKDFNMTVAYRFTDVKADYGHGLTAKPLNSRHKGLFTASYSPMMGIWQFDITCAINGGGRMPEPYTLADGSASWASHYKPYPSLNAQVTRNWRHWAVYAGGENLTGFTQKSPIVDAGDPWGDNFDATMVYGPLHGAIVYVGFRYNFTKY